MKNEKREVDRLARDVSAWWKKSLRYATLKQILTWRAMFVILFAIGIIAGIIWSVQMKIETRSRAAAGEAALSWEPNKESDLAGYRIYYGTSKRGANCPTGNHGYTAKVSVGKVSSHTIGNLTEGKTYYFSISAFDVNGNESCFSGETSKSIPFAASDTGNPVVTISNPADGAKVSGTVKISASATDADGIEWMSLFIDGQKITSSWGGSFSYDWDTTKLSDGTHSILVKAADKKGVTGEKSINVSVSNSTVSTKPVVTITKPSDGSVVSGEVTITASATDADGIEWMSLFIDGKKITSSYGGSFKYTWNTKKETNAKHTILIKAADFKKDTGQSSISVTVKN